MNDHGKPQGQIESNLNRWVSSSRLSHRSVFGFPGGSEQQFHPQSLDFIKIGITLISLQHPHRKQVTSFLRLPTIKSLLIHLCFLDLQSTIEVWSPQNQYFIHTSGSKSLLSSRKIEGLQWKALIHLSLTLSEVFTWAEKSTYDHGEISNPVIKILL